MDRAENDAGTLSGARQGPGRALFDARRWILPPFVVAAFALGGASPGGRLTGAVLLAGAVALHLWACRHIGGASRVHARKAHKIRPLVVSGPFAWLRNPIYLGNVVGGAGACLLMGPAWLAAVALIGTGMLYDRVVGWEEDLLGEMHGAAYERYRSEVPRWRPRRPGGRSVAGQPLTPWGKVLRRERGTLVVVLCGLLLALLRWRLG